MQLQFWEAVYTSSDGIDVIFGHYEILLSVADEVAVFLGNALYSACINGHQYVRRQFPVLPNSVLRTVSKRAG